MENSNTAQSFVLPVCPICEAGELRALGRDSARCGSCGCLIGGTILKTLFQIKTLPDALGKHACECGHPEMRRLPDGVFWCPACRSEVLPVRSPGDPWKSQGHSEAYWSGWMDGRFRELGNFAHNGHLTRWESASARLDYYRGHREGREARLTARRRPLKTS
jgi:ribosomal protein L37AE/L43A